MTSDKEKSSEKKVTKKQKHEIKVDKPTNSVGLIAKVADSVSEMVAGENKKPNTRSGNGKKPRIEQGIDTVERDHKAILGQRDGEPSSTNTSDTSNGSTSSTINGNVQNDDPGKTHTDQPNDVQESTNSHPEDHDNNINRSQTEGRNPFASSTPLELNQAAELEYSFKGLENTRKELLEEFDGIDDEIDNEAIPEEVEQMDIDPTTGLKRALEISPETSPGDPNKMIRVTPSPPTTLHPSLPLLPPSLPLLPLPLPPPKDNTSSEMSTVAGMITELKQFIVNEGKERDKLINLQTNAMTNLQKKVTDMETTQINLQKGIDTIKTANTRMNQIEMEQKANKVDKNLLNEINNKVQAITASSKNDIRKEVNDILEQRYAQDLEVMSKELKKAQDTRLEKITVEATTIAAQELQKEIRTINPEQQRIADDNRDRSIYENSSTIKIGFNTNVTYMTNPQLKTYLEKIFDKGTLSKIVTASTNRRFAFIKLDSPYSATTLLRKMNTAISKNKMKRVAAHKLVLPADIEKSKQVTKELRKTVQAPATHPFINIFYKPFKNKEGKMQMEMMFEVVMKRDIRQRKYFRGEFDKEVNKWYAIDITKEFFDLYAKSGKGENGLKTYTMDNTERNYKEKLFTNQYMFTYAPGQDRKEPETLTFLPRNRFINNEQAGPAETAAAAAAASAENAATGDREQPMEEESIVEEY